MHAFVIAVIELTSGISGLGWQLIQVVNTTLEVHRFPHLSQNYIFLEIDLEANEIRAPSVYIGKNLPSLEI